MKSDRWTEDLYLYRIKPAPPKVDDFQEYIALYLAEKDEKYLGWFLHYYEPRLNTVIMQMVQETAMQGHFADLKQAYIFGICKALQKYDISTGVPFLIFKEFYVKNEIDNYIRTMRQGYSVLSVDEYRTLKKAMALYAKYEYKFDEETITKIAAAIGKSIKDTKEIIRSGIDSTHYTDFYRRYADCLIAKFLQVTGQIMLQVLLPHTENIIKSDHLAPPSATVIEVLWQNALPMMRQMLQTLQAAHGSSDAR